MERVVVDIVSPSNLFELYKKLPGETQLAFRNLIASELSSEDWFAILKGMSVDEQLKTGQRLGEPFFNRLFPLMAEKAIKLARLHPDFTDEQMKNSVMDNTNLLVKDISAQQHARHKHHRDRKSDPENVERNVIICDLSKDKKTWTQGKLAKKYEMTPAGIRKILKEEVKWRALKASKQMRTK